MLGLELASKDEGPLRVLCLGAHCDDIEIGCGGTLLALQEQRELEIFWVVFSSNEQRAAESTRSAAAFMGEGPGRQLRILQHRDGFLPYVGAAVKDEFEGLKKLVSPDLVFTHTRADLHQDHRLVCELTWNTFRNHLVLEYEIPKWDGDLGQPNTFVALTEQVARTKAALLVEHYRSQAGKRWFTEDLFLSLMRLRGMECSAPSGYAEAFTSRKLGLRL